MKKLINEMKEIKRIDIKEFRGDILVDLRLHDKGTIARNHGTGFRTFENKLPRLFNEIIDI